MTPLLPRVVRVPVPSYTSVFFSTAEPANLKSSVDISATALDSVNDTNVKIEPEPTCGAGVVDSSPLPEILNRIVDSGGLDPVASVVLENPKSDPEPI